MRLVLNWIIVALSLVFLAWLLPGIDVANWGVAFLAGLIIGLINVLIRPLLQLLALPITVLTLGLFAFVINALLFWLAAALVPGFEVDGFLYALIGSLLLTLIYTLFDRILDRVLAPA